MLRRLAFVGFAAAVLLVFEGCTGCGGGTSGNGDCPAGTLACGTDSSGATQCVAESSTNCGTCGQVCGGGMTCVSGSCTCPASTTSCNGTCVDTSSDNANCGACGHACSSGMFCVSGSCQATCPPSQVCGADCCSSGAICIQDSSGNKSCAQSCTSNNQCPGSAPCCQLLSNGQAACVPNSMATACRCTTGAECASTACAPATDSSGNPVGPFICKANDGQPYDGCKGAVTCAGSQFCCVGDTAGNLFCASQCVNSTQCGGAECNTYDFSHTTCSGPTACGP